MRKSSTSLADYLTRPNPSIHSVHGDRPTPGTTTKNFRWNFPDDIRPWEDFDLKTFDRFYARPLQHVLDSQYDFNDPPKIQEFPFCEIRDEDSLEALLIVSIHSTVSEALTVTQGDLKAQASGDVIYMARGGHALFDDLQKKKGSSNKKSKHKSFRPDWAGVRRSSHQTELGRNLLPGDSKLSKVFKSNDIVTGNEDIPMSTKPNWYWVLSQIYTYCIKAGAPYGYVITDKELVVVHLRPNDTDAAHPAISKRRSSRGAGPPEQQIDNMPILEFKAISWNHDQDKEGLSVALALWWLHMIAHGVVSDGYITQDHHFHQAQPEEGQDALDSGSSFHGFDSQERRTPPPSNVRTTDTLDTNASFTSDIRHGLSGTALDDSDGDGSPTLGRGGKKRRRENDNADGGGRKPRKTK